MYYDYVNEAALNMRLSCLHQNLRMVSLPINIVLEVEKVVLSGHSRLCILWSFASWHYNNLLWGRLKCKLTLMVSMVGSLRFSFNPHAFTFMNKSMQVRKLLFELLVFILFKFAL